MYSCVQLCNVNLREDKRIVNRESKLNMPKMSRTLDPAHSTGGATAYTPNVSTTKVAMDTMHFAEQQNWW